MILIPPKPLPGTHGAASRMPLSLSLSVHITHSAPPDAVSTPRDGSQKRPPASCQSDMSCGVLGGEYMPSSSSLFALGE